MNGEPLLLKDAISMSMEHGINASILRQQNEGLTQKINHLEERSTRHVLTGRTGFARNEIEDSQDLEASAMETSVYILSYQQIFQNGISWSASQTMRSGKALTVTQSDEEYTKQLLTLKLPIYGKMADIEWLSNQKQRIDIEASQKLLENRKNTLQIEVAVLFFESLLQTETWHVSNEKLILYQAENERNRQTRSTGLENQLTDLALKREKLSNSEHHALAEQARRQLELYLGNKLDADLVLPEQLPSINWDKNEALKAYQENTTVLLLLKRNLQVLQQEEAISDLDTVPDIVASGFVGSSALNEVEGSNYGLNLTVSYSFGGGEVEKSSSIRKEVAALKMEIQREQMKAEFDYYHDLKLFQTSSGKAKLAIEELEIYKKKLGLARYEFDLGEIDREELTDLELQLLEKQLSMVQSQADCWTSYFKLLKRMDKPLIDILR